MRYRKRARSPRRVRMVSEVRWNASGLGVLERSAFMSVVIKFDGLIFTFRDGTSLRLSPYLGLIYRYLGLLTPARH